MKRPPLFFQLKMETRKTTKVIKYRKLCCVLLEMFFLPQGMKTLKFEHQ